MPRASTHVSKSRQTTMARNERRVESAIGETLTDCTYGRIVKALGNKMFLLLTPDRKEHLGHIRGKMARVALDDIVLLNVRSYESRSASSKSVFDIMALFSPKDISKLMKANMIPKWMTVKGGSDEGVGDDLFDIGGCDDEDEFQIFDVAEEPKKKSAVISGGAGATAPTLDDDAVAAMIDDI
jgi:translation initiation factor IF-1